MSTLSVEGLGVRYGHTVAVHDVHFGVEPGEIFSLIGPNGAGKTSTLAVIEGLRAPDSGDVRIFHVDPRREPRRARAALGVQLQSTSFQPDLTLIELVQLYAGLYGIRMGARAARLRLDAAGLGPVADRRPRAVSGGQLQRLGLLVADIHSPPLLLLDEPTTGLDPVSRRALWQHIEQVRRDGRSVLLTTHSMEEAAALSDRIGILVAGTLVATDTPAGLIQRFGADPRVRRVARGAATLEDVFVGITGGQEVRA